MLLFVLGNSAAIAGENEAVEPLQSRIGLEGGFNLASLTGASANDVFASRLGFVGGAFVNVPLGASLAVQPELLYSQKGGKYNGYPYQLDYMEVPILLDVNIIGPLGILLGPSFSANVAYTGVALVNKTDIGVVLGLQAFLSKFLVSGRYEVGLTDISSTQQIQNGTFTFMAGLSFI